MEDRTRLSVIELELDNTTPNGPYRVSRQRLNRERERILKRINGRDPRWFATNKKEGKINENSLDLFNLKSQVIKIINIIEEVK